MNCVEFRDRLESAIEGRRPLETAAAEAHLRECGDASCRREWQAAVLLDRGIVEWRGVVPEVDIVDCVVAEWRSGPGQPVRTTSGQADGVHLANGRAKGRSARHNPKRSVVSPATWSAIAVAMVLCVGTLALIFSGPNGAPPVAHQPRPSPPDAGNDARAQPTAMLVARSEPALQDMGRSYVGFMQNATFAVTDVVVLTLGGDEQLEEPSPAARWVHRWRDELDPIRDDVDDALEKFLKTFPDSFPST